MKSISITFIMLVYFLFSTAAQNKTEGKITYTLKMNLHASLKGDNLMYKALIPEFSESIVIMMFKGKQAKIFSQESSSDSKDGKIQISNESSDEYVDFNKNLIFNTISIENKKYHTEMALEKKELDPLDKKENICGYNCKIAKLKLGDEDYTIFYTTEISGNYSPNTELFVDGVILKIENKLQTFTAEKVDFLKVDLKVITIPKDSRKITEEQFDDLLEEQFEMEDF